jgi:hypothetical protein
MMIEDTAHLNEQEKRRFWGHLLYLALIGIRAVAADGNARLAYSMADATHNIPALLVGSEEPLNDTWLMEQLAERAVMDGWGQMLDQWIIESLTKTKIPAGRNAGLNS